jgi:hypothetical protein
MNIQEDIQREQGAVEVQTANLRELARLVLGYQSALDTHLSSYDDDGANAITGSYEAMINFAKGVAQ